VSAVWMPEESFAMIWIEDATKFETFLHAPSAAARVVERIVLEIVCMRTFLF